MMPGESEKGRAGGGLSLNKGPYSQLCVHANVSQVNRSAWKNQTRTAADRGFCHQPITDVSLSSFLGNKNIMTRMQRKMDALTGNMLLFRGAGDVVMCWRQRDTA